jgi:hypothetical protein
VSNNNAGPSRTRSCESAGFHLGLYIHFWYIMKLQAEVGWPALCYAVPLVTTLLMGDALLESRGSCWHGIGIVRSCEAEA